ncbi:MAG: metal-dependent transcriptional regulator [Candidatus Omnitrophica bacterium]|nr:metal-dependent transcriptional regulator [Candidatus Omnitrophota bacterium]
MKTKKAEKLSSSMEDYLETIAILQKTAGVVRVKDISLSLKVKKPSVTNALNVLSEKGFIVHEKYGYVDLTDEGRKIAEAVLKRHDTLIKFLTKILKINSGIAAKDACRMEHAMSPETFGKLTRFIEKKTKK